LWISGLRRVNCTRNEPAITGVLVWSDRRREFPQLLEDRPQTELIRRPVSRVLSRALRPLGDHSSGTPLAGRLARPTRTEREGAPVPYGTPVPIRSCSRRGLPCHPCYQGRGGLLPHPFTLTSPVARKGGLLSVALSLGPTPCERSPGRTLSAALPTWSPDFPPVSCPTSGRPAA
jgi:hypothetical protein